MHRSNIRRFSTFQTVAQRVLALFHEHGVYQAFELRAERGSSGQRGSKHRDATRVDREACGHEGRVENDAMVDHDASLSLRLLLRSLDPRQSQRKKG